MNRRLPAGQLQDLGAPFHFDKPIDRSTNGVKAEMFSLRSAGGKAHGAVEIAGRGQFDEPYASVLFVIGTETAVIRAAFGRSAAMLLGKLAGQHEFKSIKPIDVGTHKIFSFPACAATFFEIDPFASRNDLGREQLETIGTKTLRGAEKRVLCVSHR